MIQAFRELRHFLDRTFVRRIQPKVILEFKDTNDLLYFQWYMNDECMIKNPSDIRNGTMYGIPFELRVK